MSRRSGTATYRAYRPALALAIKCRAASSVLGTRLALTGAPRGTLPDERPGGRQLGLGRGQMFPRAGVSDAHRSHLPEPITGPFPVRPSWLECWEPASPYGARLRVLVTYHLALIGLVLSLI